MGLSSSLDRQYFQGLQRQHQQKLDEISDRITAGNFPFTVACSADQESNREIMKHLRSMGYEIDIINSHLDGRLIDNRLMKIDNPFINGSTGGIPHASLVAKAVK